MDNLDLILDNGRYAFDRIIQVTTYCIPYDSVRGDLVSDLEAVRLMVNNIEGIWAIYNPQQFLDTINALHSLYSFGSEATDEIHLTFLVVKESINRGFPSELTETNIEGSLS